MRLTTEWRSAAGCFVSDGRRLCLVIAMNRGYAIAGARARARACAFSSRIHGGRFCCSLARITLHHLLRDPEVTLPRFRQFRSDLSQLPESVGRDRGKRACSASEV